VFAIALQQDHYKTYILSDQVAQSRLEIVPERGGIVTRWQLRGQDILYLDAERFANPELTVRGGVPILFPICGNLPGNSYTIEGQPYTLKQHGFARDLPWQVSDRSTQECVSITLTLASSDVTRALYPFDFHLAFTYRLRGNSLELEQQVTNRGDRPMPFSLGFHPYFQTSDKSQLQFEIPATRLLNQRTGESQSFSGQFDVEQDEIDVIFRELSGQTATVSDRARNLRLTMEFDDFYPFLVFWTVRGKDFYCLEPWSAGRNAMNTGDRLTHLPPGESLHTSFRLTVKPL
jgi:galactose mutarotase-like enzyme